MFALAKPCWEYFLKHEGHIFDENYFPAYFEDNDFHYRLKLAITKKYGNLKMHAGTKKMNPALFRNSMTIKKDPKVNSGFTANQKYFTKKWGGPPGHEKFKTAWNK